MENKTNIQTVVVTGATSGIGFAVTKLLIQKGAYVIGVGRSEQRNRTAQERILTEYPSGRIDYFRADLAEPKMIKRLATDIRHSLNVKGYSHLDALINNAGVYLEKKQSNTEGIEKTFAINHLAQFQLTHDLLLLLARSKLGKMISVSSYAHFTTPLNPGRIADPWPYIGLLAYKRSKLCNVLFVRGLNNRTNQIIGFAADPGLVNTHIASKSGEGISDWVWSHRRKSGMSPETAAEDLVFILTSKDLDPSTGQYIKERKPLQPSRNARNDDLVERLWALSCELTGLSWG